MTFTTGQAFTFIVAIIGLGLTIINIYDKLTTIKKNADAPFKDLEKRVTALEVKQNENEDRFKRGNDHFRNQSEFNKMFMQVQLAFVDFEMAFCQHTNYTDTGDLIKAKNNLQTALTNITIDKQNNG